MNLFSKLHSVEHCQSLQDKVWFPSRSGWVEGAYCVEGSCQGEADVIIYVGDHRCVAAQNVTDGTN